MKTIIAGSRSIGDVELVESIIEDFLKNNEITEVVCGEAFGVDTIGEQWAKKNDITVQSFPPNYELYGSKIAPLMRNTEMANYADALIAVHNGSNGTRDMIKKAMKNKLKLHIVDVRDL